MGVSQNGHLNLLGCSPNTRWWKGCVNTLAARAVHLGQGHGRVARLTYLETECSGLMYPDTDLGENARHGEVFDEQAKTYISP